ncbi:MAG TPA: 30S ribosomal protein S2 [Candidatus Babeliales bacterium]|nr:30S ribosomal protein S2 [Candidatus Babeliales bacterium]
MIDFKKLVQEGVHFGHQKNRWCPKMAPYIWGTKNNIHLIDVSKTAVQLEKAANFLQGLAAEGKSILWVGTKKSARDIVTTAGNGLNMPFVYHRWIGGTLSNNSQVKKSVTKLLHFEDIVSKTERAQHYTKKEYNVFQKMVERLEKNVGGIKNLSWPLGAVVLVDVRKERAALKEAATMGIPVVALVDTNSDPSGVDFVIPANDDSPRSINVIIEYLSAAVSKGIEAGKERVAKEKEERYAAKKDGEAVKKASPAKVEVAKDVKAADKETAVVADMPE